MRSKTHDRTVCGEDQVFEALVYARGALGQASHKILISKCQQIRKLGLYVTSMMESQKGKGRSVGHDVRARERESSGSPGFLRGNILQRRVLVWVDRSLARVQSYRSGI